MFTVLVHPEHNLPIVISKNSLEYSDFILSGYIEIDSGSKREMHELAQDMMEEIYAHE